MKATFVASELSVLAYLIRISESKEILEENLNKLYEKDDSKEKIAKIVKNPANLAFSWVRIDKSEENLDFLTSLLLLSASNNFLISNKDVILTKDSAFISNALLLAYNENIEEEKDKISVDISDKIQKDILSGMCSNLFDTTQFVEIYSTENGPQMFMLAASFSRDTWDLMSTIGIVGKTNSILSTGSRTQRVPGICLMFGLAAGTLVAMTEGSKNMPEHIAKDLNSIPRAKKEENEKN